MIDNLHTTERRALRHGCLGLIAVAFCGIGLGCAAFNPAFLDLLDPSGTGRYATLDNAPGHVVIMFSNNAEVDERLITYLESPDGGNLTFTDAEKQALRPRMRLRVQVTFTNGEAQTIEFIDGSRDLVEEGFDALSFPDLNQNDLNRVAVVCDVARVEVINPIEVFIPVSYTVWDWVESTGLAQGYYRVSSETDPQFYTLREDDVDADRNTLLQRNIGIRDVPAPVDDLLCGSVVAITMDGVLSVPFFRAMGGMPGWDAGDAAMAATLGGRYEFTVTVH